MSLRVPRAASIARVALVAIVAQVLLAAACAPQESVVAELPPAPDGGACASPADCPPDFFCAKPSCDAPTGACQRRPIVCPSDEEVTCGCDLVSYWNDCLRQRNGVAAGSRGQCLTTVAPCGGPDHAVCEAAGAVCAQLVDGPTQCDPDAPGACWVVPSDCHAHDGGAPPPPGGPPFGDCRDPQRCLDACDAIQAGLAFRLPPHAQCR